MRTGRVAIVVALGGVALSGCSSLCLTDVCRAQFSSPAAPRAITPEPSNQTSDGMRIPRSYEELHRILQAANEDLVQSKAALDDVESRQKALLDELTREAAWLSCAEQHPKCGLIAVTLGTPEFIAEFSKSECREPFRKKLSRSCSDKYDALFNGALGERYQLADVAAVNKQCAEAPGCKSMTAYELLCIKSHNDELLRRFNVLNEPLQQERDRRSAAYASQVKATVERNDRLIKAFEQAQEQREQRARDLEQLRAEQEAQTRENTRRRAAMAAALQAVSASMSAAANQTASVQSPSGCSSDYECGPGHRCVKGAYEMTGVCMTAVNQYGVQSFAPPAPSSLGPGQRQCWTLAECPATFRCESGQCVR